MGEVGFGLEGNSGENGLKLAISVQPDTPTPRRRSPCLGIELRLGGPETGFLAFFGPPRLTSPPRRSQGVPVSFVFVALFH